MNKILALEVKPGTSNGLPYTDGSGAPAVVTVRSGQQILRYALDFIVEAKLTLLSNPVGMTRTTYGQAADVAREAYTAWLSNQVNGQWFSANREMYQ